MIGCLSALCVLGMAAIALLLMTGVISLEKALGFLARGFVTVLVFVWVICIVKELIAAALPAVRVAAHWITFFALAIVVVVLVVMVAAGFGRRLPQQIGRKRGGHESDKQ